MWIWFPPPCSPCPPVNIHEDPPHGLPRDRRRARHRAHRRPGGRGRLESSAFGTVRAWAAAQGTCRTGLAWGLIGLPADPSGPAGASKEAVLNRIYSLRNLLLAHDLAFVLLIAVTGAMGWLGFNLRQQAAEEDLRVNTLVSLVQEVRGDLYRQMSEVFDHTFLGEPTAVTEYLSIGQRMTVGFGLLLACLLGTIALSLWQQMRLAELTTIQYERPFMVATAVASATLLPRLPRPEVPRSLAREDLTGFLAVSGAAVAGYRLRWGLHRTRVKASVGKVV